MSDIITLKKSNCKNCYKCIRHCPVKSIRFSANQAHVIGNECILCGRCYVICPQNAKEIKSELEKTKVLIQSGDPVYVSIAPSFIAEFEGSGINGMRAALKKLGFKDTQIFTTMEMRMKCGIGKCGRCNIGDKFVCKDGPVFSFDQLGELPPEY